MTLDYFYGGEADQFSFYRIPKVLFTDPQYQTISVEAKVLYGLLLDRMSLSMKNGWTDKDGRVYIIFTVEDIMAAMGCGDQKAGKLLNELERKAGRIERKRQGLGKPNLIFVKNFVTGSKSRIKKSENHDSGQVNNTDQEPLNSRGNNTDRIKTEYNDTDSIPFTSFREPALKRYDATERAEYREFIKENIEYEILVGNYPYDLDTLEEILGLIVDVVCTSKATIRISGDDKPAEVVRSQFLKLNSEHISFVLDSLSQNTTRIRNIKQYLLATLYNAPLTIGNYYRSLVSHDMAEGSI